MVTLGISSHQTVRERLYVEMPGLRSGGIGRIFVPKTLRECLESEMAVLKSGGIGGPFRLKISHEVLL